MKKIIIIQNLNDRYNIICQQEKNRVAVNALRPGGG